MLNNELFSANQAFCKQQFNEACSLYEQCFPSNGKALASLLKDKPILKHVYRNYLYSMLAIGEQNKIERLLYEYKAADPEDSILTENSAFRVDVEKQDCSSPLLSIIVPIYNSAQYVDFCIQSIREQSFTDFELILINDGSTDASPQIIAQHAEQDTRIVVISNDRPSGNPGTPRNQALNIAKGRYVGFVDSDDWINRDFYSSLMRLALADNADIAFSGGFNNHESNGRVSKRSYSTEGFDDSRSSRFKTHDSFMIWDKVFKRSMLEMFQIRLGETKAAVDVPFVFAAYYYASKIAYDDSFIGYNYRRESDSSVTVAHRKNSNCEFEFQAFSAVRLWAEENNVADYYFSTIDVKLVSSLMYTLKLVSDDYFESVLSKVKALFEEVDDDSFKAFCVENKKWWQYKEFLIVLRKEPLEIKYYLDEKENASQARTLEQLLEPRYSLHGERDGILFFPCWMTNNPYQKLFYEAIHREYNVSIEGFDQKALCKELIDRKKRNFKYVHLHWLHNFFDLNNPELLENTLEVLSYAKREGFEIIYTAHNICSHDSPNQELEHKNRAKVLKLVDHSLVHGHFAKKRLMDEFGFNSNAIHLVPHGTYGEFYGKPIPKDRAKEKFGISSSAIVFLFFGNIKGYKGIFNLISSFKNLREKQEHIHLIIAGRVLNNELLPRLAEETKDTNILYRPGFVQNHEVVDYFSCADLCVLPYEAVLTSGAAMLSLSLKCPVLAPSIGVLPEVVDDDVGMLFDSFEDMEEKMSQFSNSKKSQFKARNFDAFLKAYDWENLIRDISFLR